MNEKDYPVFRWLVLVTMFTVTVIASIFLIAPAPLISEMMRAMPGISAGQVTFITMSIFNIFVLVSTILGGPLLDKFGVMKIYIGGLILITIGALLTPIIGSSFGGMIFIRILQGAGTGPIMVSVVPVAALYFPPKQRSILIVLQGIATLIGVQIGLVCTPMISQATGNWQTALAWLAASSIFGLILSFIVASKSEQHVMESEIASAFMEDIKHSLIKPVTWAVIGCLAMFNLMYQGFNNVIPGYVSAAPPAGLGYNPETIGSLMSGAQLLLICGGIIGVLITEKLLKGNARPVLLIGFVLAAIFIYLTKVTAMASNQTILLVYVYSTAFFSAFISPQALGYIAKYYPRRITGTLGGLAGGISSLVILAGVAACAKAIKVSGYQMSFSIIIGVAIIGAIIALFLKPMNEQ